jgi:hypothetical protein
MRQISRHASVFFASGCLGGLFNGLAVWLLGAAGVTSMFGVQLAPALTPAMIYQRLVWGGIWGFLFFIPLRTRSAVSRGLVLSIAPTLVQLLAVFPFKSGKGMLGLELGLLTPVFVILFNAVWGVAASLWLRYTAEHS